MQAFFIAVILAVIVMVFLFFVIFCFFANRIAAIIIFHVLGGVNPNLNENKRTNLSGPFGLFLVSLIFVETRNQFIKRGVTEKPNE
jgi:hypothetical protein